MVNPGADRPAYVQLADSLRARIESGEWRPGYLIPAEPVLRHEYGVGRTTVRDAVALLRAEGRVSVVRGVGTFVRDVEDRKVVRVPGPAVVLSRAPSRAERERLELDRWALVIVVRSAAGEQVYPADGYMVEITTDP